MPDWIKVNSAAVAGLVITSSSTVFEKLGPVLDVLIKVGQVGVAAVTIGYIYTKWRNARNKK